MQQDRGCGFLDAQPTAWFDLALTQATGQPDDAGQRAHVGLLILLQSAERAVGRFGFGTTMVTNRPGEQLPFLARPRRRNRPLEQKAAHRFLSRLALALEAQAAEALRAPQDTPHF